MTGRTDRPVVAGVDGSADARRALCLAGEIARELDTEIVVVHGVGLMEELDGRIVPTSEHRAEIVAAFERWCEALRTVGVDEWVPRLENGPPVDTVLSVADELDACLVVVGRHGSGQRAELLLGSTAHQVAERSRCPVLVVPPVGRVSRPGEGREGVGSSID